MADLGAGPPPTNVPLADPASENAKLRDAILSALGSVVSEGRYILGPRVAAFEAAMAEAVGVPGAVGVGSGTDALVLALLAAGVGPGHEVIAPSHTAGPTVAAIRITGATPVLVDIDPVTYCITPQTVAAGLSPAVRAVIVVHLYGHAADMAGIRAVLAGREIALIEDCAQAQGTRLDGAQVGTIGEFGCFSFYPTKNLGGIGDGGAVVARSPAHLEQLRMLRSYGWRAPQFAEIAGGRCSRLDELQAAMLHIKIAHLEDMIARRRRIAARYRDAFADLPVVVPVERGCVHSYHLFVIRTPRRDKVQGELARRGIQTGRHYPYPVHVQPGLAQGARIPAPLVETEKAQHEILSLPMFSSMTDAQIVRTIAAVAEVVRHV